MGSTMRQRSDTQRQSAGAPNVVRRLEALACEALVEDCKLAPRDARERLEAELDHYRRLDIHAHHLSAVFRRFCVSLGNRGRTRNVLFGGRSAADWDRFTPVLCGHEPARLLESYRESESLCRALLTQRPELAGAKRERQLTHPRSAFRQYAAGLLAGARYFAEFQDGREFAAFIEPWLAHADMAQMLPEYFARVQGVVATPPCAGESRCSLSASAGVFHPRVLRGRVLSARATAARSSAECRDRSVPLGKY